MATPLRFGRNLQSLEFTSDITNRATRLMPLTNPIGGERTFLGSSRWKVTNNASGVLTLADPAGGPGPVAFDDQLNAIGAYYLFREITAQAYAITDSAASPNTVTITGDPGIAVGEFVQFRTSATAGTPIAVGPGGGVGTLSRGYILPLLATSLSSAVLTIAQPIAAPAAPTADGQYVGDDVAFSNFVQTSTAGFTPGDGWPSYTVTWVSGTDFSGLAVGDWLITGDLSVWEGGGGSGSSLPPMTVTAITDSTHIQVAVRGAGPSFAQGVGSTPLQFFRPVAANPTGTVTASSASAHTVTVDDATSLVATTGAPCALELSYTPVAGELPYYLDHPVYAATPATPTDPGIGIKFGTIDRGNLVAVPNLSPNALARHWTAGVPDGYAITGSGATMTQNTDALFTELGGSSILVAFGGSQQYFDTPPIAWRPAYVGQRFSVRAHLLIPALWSGNAILDMRFGIVTADGTRKMWFPPDPQLRMMPPDAVNAPSDAQKPAQGAWFDAVIHGFDITTAQGLGGFSAVGQADLADAVAYFVRFYNTQGVPPFYFDGISITPSDVAVDQGNITEFGQANNAWQDTNVALSLLGKPQQSIGVDVLDLYALNPDSVDAIDKLTYPGDVLAHAPDLGLVNESQRIVEIVRNLKRPGAVRITLGQRLKRFTDLFVHQATAQTKATAAATAASQSSGNGTTTVTPPSGSGTPPGGTTGTSLPSVTLGVALDSSNVPTATAVGNSVVVRVKFAGRTDRYPTLAETQAETSVTPAPFSTTFAALTSGQTQYVAALGYDAANDESPLVTASVENPAPIGHGFSRPLTIDHTKVGASPSTDFPILVSGTYAYLATVANGGKVDNANGYDVGFFADAAHTTRLKHETEKYVATTGEVIYWVKVPTVSNTADTVIYIGYGDPSITTDQSDPAGTWSNGFTRVVHMGDGVTLSGVDSVAGANFAVTAATAAAGQIDGAGSFDLASNKYLKDAAPAATAIPLTISAWAKASDLTLANGEDRIIAAIAKSSAAEDFWIGYYNQSGTVLLRTVIQGSGVGGYYRGNPTLDTNWHLYHVVLNTSVPAGVQYQDATVLHGTGSDFTGGAATPSGLTDTYIGGVFLSGSFAGAWKGQLDEVRVATVARSADWITAEYNNQSSPSTFYSIGTESGSDAGPGAVSLSSVFSGGDVIVTAAARFASSVKMDASLSGTPTDTDVRGTTALTSLPFSKTFPAPTGTDVLHVKAFAYYAVLGGTESAAATLSISAAPTAATTADVAAVAGAEFVTTSASGALSAERVLTDTATITKDVATAGQVKLNVVLDTDGTLAADSDTAIASQKATKTYVDAKVAGLSWKQAVRAATTVAGTLASSFANSSVIDGVTLATGDRILIKNQSTGSENGIYIVAASGAPTRATDADSGAELVNASCYVSEGTTNADTQWVCTTNATITVGSTSLAFAQLTSGGSSALTGLTDVNITSVANDDVLTWNSGSSKWINQAPSGGGSGNGRWDPVALRSGQSASSQDDDWSGTGTTLNARWTGNANWPPTAFDIDTTAPKRLYIRAAGNSTAARVILQAVPAGDFAIQTIVAVGPNNANLSHAGLYLTDGTGGSANVCEVSNYQSGASGGSQCAVQSGTAANITTNLISPFTAALNPITLRIERASGVYTAEFSPDGIIGYRFTFSPGFTPTHFGVGGAPFSGELRAGFGSFRYSATSTTRWGAYL